MHIYIYIYSNRIFTLPYRPAHSTVSKTRSFSPLSSFLFSFDTRGEAERYTVLERWKSTESSLIEEGGEESVAMEGLSRNSSEKLLLLLVFMSR